MKSMQNVRIILTILLLSSLSFISCKKERQNKDVTISYSWWGKEERNKYTLEGLSNFESEHPNIKVLTEYSSWEEYEESFKEKLKSGQCADLMQVNFDWLHKYSTEADYFYNLKELSDYIDLYNFTLDDLEYGTINGQLLGIPIAFNTAIPVFNNSILQKYSFNIPSTWDDLFDMAKVLKENGMYVFTISKRHLFFVAMAWFEQTYSKKMFTEQGSLNISADEVGIIYDFIKKLVDENVVYAINDGFQLDAITNKKVAGAVVWCNETSIFISEVAKFGEQAILGNFISIPGAKESGWYLKPACLYVIKKDCKYAKETAQLLNYLLNDQNYALLQKNEKGVPISNISLTALMEANKLESMQYKALMKIRFNNDSINQMLPFMEENNLILPFADNAYSYIIGQKTKLQAVNSFINLIN